MWTYGDFPELFWDAQPDVPLDVRNPIALARILTRARTEVIAKLVPLEVIEEELDKLFLPEHYRRFWECVLEVHREK